MKEHGIIFNTEMIRAILDGRKTQTRRIIKSVPTTHNFHGWIMSSTCAKDEGKACWATGNSSLLKDPIRLNCPFGQPGDRLYVREQFSRLESFGFFDSAVPYEVPDFWYWADGEPEWGNWTRPQSGAVMPRNASRISLEVTGVRVERLQDISEEDAVAEGVAPLHGGYWKHYQPDWTQHQLSARGSFVTLWTSINGTDAWYKNPWVWCINFRRLK